MMNAMKAKELTNNFKANEIAKMNEYAALHADHIAEEIAVAAKQGKEYIDITIEGDLKNLDMRVRVCTILKNNGYYVKVKHNYIFIAW